MSLAERLGHSADARLLIVTCDNLGAYHAANLGCYEALAAGLATTASLMVPAPWAREAVRGYRGSDVGVHLTLNAEFECYRWGSITRAPSLYSGEGGFPRAVNDLWEHADSEEVRRECRAQIERSIVWGFDPSHLDSHLDALVLRPELFDVYVDLAVEFGLPLRLTGAAAEERAGFPLRDLVRDEGLLTPDHCVRLNGHDRRSAFLALLDEMPPGVTELALQPSIDTPEVRALTASAGERIGDYELLIDDSMVHAADEAGVDLISWSALRDAQRA